MGIINGYHDVDIVISDLREDEIRSLVSGRQFAVIRIAPEIIEEHRRKCRFKFYPSYFLDLPFFTQYSLQIDDGDEASGRSYLYIDDQLPMGANAEPLCAKVRDGVSIQYLSIEELISMVLGKRLIYHSEYEGDHYCVESVINRKMQEHIFRLREVEEQEEELDEERDGELDGEPDGVFYLYDSFFSVEVFLQKISDEDSGEQEFLQPADVRDFDINRKILSTLKKGSNSFYNDAMTINYASVSDQLQAQYFLAKFHSNRLWELDPVCILNYRISTFILPHSISKERAADFPEDRIAYDIKHKTRHVIDSIHVDSDICFSLSEFDELIERFMYNIRLA